jgi:hypothetical protein
MSSKNAHTRTAAEKMKEVVAEWLNRLAADFCDEGIVTLVQRLGKCPTSLAKGSSRLCYVWANARLL